MKITISLLLPSTFAFVPHFLSGRLGRIHRSFAVSPQDDDNMWRADFQKAKNEKLGAQIPPEQAKLAAENAENEFLNAMKETTEEFQEAKEEFGSDGAVDFFLEKIYEEDKRREQEEDEEKLRRGEEGLT